MYLILLTLSFLGTNGTMFYILFRNRFERKSSVSLHAAIDNSSHATFALGHFIGGLVFLYFAYRLFYLDNGSLPMMVVSCVGFFAEQVQALLPNKGRFVRIHTVAAVSMAASMTVLVFIALSVFKLDAKWLVAYVGLIALLCVSGAYALFNKHKFYQTQMLFFSVFYLFLLILVYGTKS